MHGQRFSLCHGGRLAQAPLPGDVCQADAAGARSMQVLAAVPGAAAEVPGGAFAGRGAANAMPGAAIVASDAANAEQAPARAAAPESVASGSDGPTARSARRHDATADGGQASRLEEDPTAGELNPEDLAASEEVSTYVVAEVAASSVAMLASGLMVGVFAGALLGALVVSGLLSSPCPSPELESGAYRAMDSPLARA